MYLKLSKDEEINFLKRQVVGKCPRAVHAPISAKMFTISFVIIKIIPIR